MKSIYKYLLLSLFISLTVNGQQHKEYHKNGDLWKVGTIEDGKKVGEWTIYTSYAGIKFKKVGTYKNDLKNGLWKSYMNDKLSSEGNYQNDKKEGEWKNYFSKNGKLKDKGNYKQGKKTGEWKSYHENGTLSSIYNYKNGVENGESLSNYDNKQKWLKGSYLNGKKDGVWNYYHQNGVLGSKTNYKNGKIEGFVESFHDNGVLEYSGNYINDKKTGLWKYYCDSGIIKFEGNYENGKNSGEWKYFDKNGNLIASENFNTNKKTILLNHYPENTSFNEDLNNILTHFYNYSEKNKSLNLKSEIITIVTEVELIDSEKNNGRLKIFIKNDEFVKIEKRFSNDKIGIIGSYLNGEKNGDWKYFDKTGILKFTKTFSNGYLTNTKFSND